MKIRTGFVSNSSSSSFICEVSGGVEAGMDASLSDFDMSECTNGHVFYNEHLVGEEVETLEFIEKINYVRKSLNDVITSSWRIENRPEQVEKAKEIIENFDDYKPSELFTMCDEFVYYDEFEEQAKPYRCPICTLIFIRDKDVLGYILEKNGLDKETIEKEIRTKHSNLSKLKGK